jgi:hypothetical protein
MHVHQGEPIQLRPLMYRLTLMLVLHNLTSYKSNHAGSYCNQGGAV